MRRAYVYKPANITAPVIAFSVRPAAGLLPWSDREKADWCVVRDTNNLACSERGYAAACAALGDANRTKGPMRRFWQAKAFRAINAARASLGRCRAALAASLNAVAELPLAVAADLLSAAA